jgi:trans-2,3-dihydro-3-hydroxyanthranilate isomerase
MMSAMRAYRYHRVDVFTDRQFCGNPLAVFPDASGLDTRTMQAIAREMNLSETTFVLPAAQPGTAAKVRIFTVDREVPLAGHPIVGTGYVLAVTGQVPVAEGRNVVQFELGAGVLPVEIDVAGGVVGTVFMTQNPPRFGKTFADRDVLAEALGLRPADLDTGLAARVVDTGIPWFLVPLRDLKALRAMAPHPLICPDLARVVGTDLWHAFTQDTGDPECAVRTRHVWWGKVTPGEDPVTGSAIGCIGSFLVQDGVILAMPEAEFAVEQGEEVGRPGEVRVRIEARGGRVTRVQVGGHAMHVGDGELRIM